MVSQFLGVRRVSFWHFEGSVLLFGGNSAVPKRKRGNSHNDALNRLAPSPALPSHEPTRAHGRLIGDNSHLHLQTLFDETVPVVRMRRKLPRNFCKAKPSRLGLS